MGMNCDAYVVNVCAVGGRLFDTVMVGGDSKFGPVGASKLIFSVAAVYEHATLNVLVNDVPSDPVLSPR